MTTGSKTVHAFSDLRITPAMAVKTAAGQLVYDIARRKVRTPADVDRFTMKCGSGERLVKADPVVRALRWLVS